VSIQSGAERREKHRLHQEITAFIRPTNQHTFKRVTTKDLSSDGLRLMLAHGLERGTALMVTLKLDEQPPITYEARVAWSRPSPSGTSCETGISLKSAVAVTHRRRFEQWLSARRVSL
jgi:hypothetical protein